MHGSVVRWCITWSFAVSIRFWRICRSGRRDCWTLLNELMGSIIRTVCRHCWRPCLMIWVVVTSSWVICWFFMIKGRALCLGWEPAKQGDLCELLKKLDYFRSVHRVLHWHTITWGYALQVLCLWVHYHWGTKKSFPPEDRNRKFLHIWDWARAYNTGSVSGYNHNLTVWFYCMNPWHNTMLVISQ